MELLKYLKGNKVVFADGAMGTMLYKYGMVAGECPEEINISRPEIIEKIYKEYNAAGAQLIQTNTFGASRIKLQPFGLENKVSEIVMESVKIAKNSVDNNTWVGLSVGPTGKFIRPLGDLSFDNLIDIFTEQISAGVEAGADCICIETMGDLAEVKAALIAAKNFNLPVSCSVSFEDQGLTLMGTDPDTYGKVISKWDCDIAASNCASPEDLLNITNIISQYINKPFYVRPNAGKPEVKNGETVYPMKPDDFASWGEKILKAGASILGGCCGTTPEHIESLSKNLSNFETVKNDIYSEKWLAPTMSSVTITDNLRGSWIKLNEYVKNNKIDNDKAIDAMKTVPQNEDDIIILDISGITPNMVEDTIEHIQMANRKPIAFKSDNKETLESFIKPYKGIAGIISSKNDDKSLLNMAKLYGGEIIKE